MANLFLQTLLKQLSGIAWPLNKDMLMANIIWVLCMASAGAFHRISPKR